MSLNITRGILTAAIFGALAFAATPVWADDAKVPETAEDHLALAKSYKEKAAGYKKEAEYHQQMLEATKKRAPAAKGAQNAWVAKMDKHCMAIVKSATKMASDNEKAAEFHEMRAKEMHGK